MSLNPIEWFDFLTPDPDATPEQMNKWRNRIAFTITVILCLVLLVAPLLSETRYAHAGELEKVHQELNASISGVRSEVGSVKSAVDDLAKSYAQKDQERAEREKATAVRDLRRQIFSTMKDACAASGLAKDVLMVQVEDLRTEFMRLTGTEYPTFDCRNIR